MNSKKNFGFTLIELLVVVAIIGILASVIIGNVNSARQRAITTKVQAELREISSAIKVLALDTGTIPSTGVTKIPEGECVCNGLCDSSSNELYVDTPEAGLLSTDGNFTDWDGPYMTSVPLDPWGGSYVFDSDYDCTTQIGCENFVGQVVSVVHSAGPNQSAINAYDSDDIVRVYCAE